jgi:hypothetical protein
MRRVRSVSNTVDAVRRLESPAFIKNGDRSNAVRSLGIFGLQAGEVQVHFSHIK